MLIERRIRENGLMVLALVALATGCGGHAGAGSGHLRRVGYPDWVTRGSGYYIDEGERAFLGVGVVSGIRNMALARTTVDNRARAEAAQLFETYILALMAEYEATLKPPAPAQDAGGFHPVAAVDTQTQSILKVFTASTLNFVQVTEHWLHPGDGGIYALARLDLRAFVESLARMQDVSDAVRVYAYGAAEPLHARFEAAQRGRSAANTTHTAP